MVIFSGIIWNGVAVCWGINFGMLSWYITSKTGITGPISMAWAIIPLCVSIILLLLNYILRIGTINTKKILTWPALLAFAYSLSTLGWYLMSNFTDGGTLSFLWVSFPGAGAFFVVGYGSAMLRRKSKTQTNIDLTLWAQKRRAIDES